VHWAQRQAWRNAEAASRECVPSAHTIVRADFSRSRRNSAGDPGGSGIAVSATGSIAFTPPLFPRRTPPASNKLLSIAPD
jgi:hypothetical protein